LAAHRVSIQQRRESESIGVRVGPAARSARAIDGAPFRARANWYVRPHSASIVVRNNEKWLTH
jgi:hypothetical protein